MTLALFLSLFFEATRAAILLRSVAKSAKMGTSGFPEVDVKKLNIGDKLELRQTSDKCDTKYCIKTHYANQSNEFFDNTTNKDEWQLQVYQYARAVFDQVGFHKVADVGCGSGYKLVKFFDDASTVGYDLEPTLSWLRNKYPKKKWTLSDFGSKDVSPVDLVISSDVVEHVSDPDAYMRYLLKFNAQYYVVSTPDRDLLSASSGPPVNPAHVREWTHDEFANYASTQGFHILDARVYRPQSTMWFLLERSGR